MVIWGQSYFSRVFSTWEVISLCLLFWISKFLCLGGSLLNVSFFPTCKTHCYYSYMVRVMLLTHGVMQQEKCYSVGLWMLRHWTAAVYHLLSTSLNVGPPQREMHVGSSTPASSLLHDPIHQAQLAVISKNLQTGLLWCARSLSG